MIIVIEKGVEKSEHVNKKWKPIIDAVKTMDIGESFLVDIPKVHNNFVLDRRQFRSDLQANIERKLGVKVNTQAYEEEYTIRVWLKERKA